MALGYILGDFFSQTHTVALALSISWAWNQVSLIFSVIYLTIQRGCDVSINYNTAPRSFVDIQIIDRQNVDILIADKKIVYITYLPSLA
jgi:hypothetical protein